MKKTLAELKREAKAGVLSGELKFFHGETKDIPQRMQGIRKIIGSNSEGITFLLQDGRTSFLKIDGATLIEYDGETLTLYEAGLRDLTPAEKAVMDAWHKKASTGSSTYWTQQAFFMNAGYEYLAGTKKAGKVIDYPTQKVRDNKVRGNMILKYKIYRVS